jgi:hypothetical protein
MPGPFPGMDPYLEDPAEWQGVHNALITYLWETLRPLLPPGYRARIEERCYIVHPDRQVIPDLTVFYRQAPPPQASAAATMIADAPLVLMTQPLELRESYIDIFSRKDHQQVVTAIELLSPTNKAAGTEGQRIYRRKQQEILTSRTNLLEIDLLREGEHTVAAPKEPLLRIGHWDYITSLHRGGQADAIEAWPTTLRERLPRINVPLDAADSDIVLDLQAVFNRYYDAGDFLHEIDYTGNPIPPMRAEDAAWADALLRERGLRPLVERAADTEMKE